MSDVEQARFEVVSTDGDFEIRQYAPSIVAETEVSGARKEAISEGFRTIADYIFGNNQSAVKVAMTAPVQQQPSEKIAMTAPVMQEGIDNAWKVRFVMPAEYSMDTLPKPNNAKVQLTQVPGKRVAVLSFSGAADDELLKDKETELRTMLKVKNIEPIGPVLYAFYNPPWTLPFLRHNEVMFEVGE